MGAKLSKKKKGYDVSDPKSKNGETPATDVAKVEDGAPSTGVESTSETAKDSVVEEAVVAAVVAAAKGAVAPEEPKSPPSDEKTLAPKDEATPEQKAAVWEAAPVAMEQIASTEQPAAEKEKAVEAAPVTEKMPLVVEEKVTVAEKVPEDPKSTPPEEPAPIAKEEVTPEQKSAALVKQAPAAEPNKSSPIEEPAPSTEATAQAVPEKPEPKIEELIVATTVTENSSAPATEKSVRVESETESAAVPEEPHAPVEPVVEPDVVLASAGATLKDREPEPIHEPVTESEATLEEKIVPTIVPEPEAEPAGEPLMESDTNPEPNQDSSQVAETVVIPEENVQPEQETDQDQPEPEPVETPETEPEPEQSSRPEVEQSPEPEQVEEIRPQPTVAASDSTDHAKPEAESSGILEALAQNVSLENHPANKEPTLQTEAAEPAPEIIISQSVSTSSMTVESDKAAMEEVTGPENEVETNVENGDLGSPSVPENTAEAVPAVNGECSDNTAALAADTECVNGNEKLEEMPVKEQSEFELKKDLCGDVQEVPDAVSDMVESLSTEVTQAV